MKRAPYTLSEAGKIVTEYSHLIGHAYDNDSATIDCIAITPFDDVNKNRFILYYLLFNDAEIALSQDYAGEEFDVLIISGSQEHGQLMYENIATWHTKNVVLRDYNCTAPQVQHPVEN